ncbi:MAG: hypothetical protein LBR41_02565 [Rickettsiales bacterium]|jgi:hypothetical protein|nr:hypothetical protein [Rickettsiales bacterium]
MENLAVVQSAVSSFNNVALHAPDFLWAAVLALPIFIAAWIFAGDITKRFFQESKWRNFATANVLMVLLPIWLLSHGSFEALRNFSWAPVIIAATLCVCASFLTRRIIAADWIPSKFVLENWMRRTDWGLPIIAAGIAGLCAIDGGFNAFVLNFGAVLIGIAAGYCFQSRGAKSRDPKWISAAAMCAITFAIAMQPEFFRWGQLGHLTAIHIVALTIAVKLFAIYFTLGMACKKSDGGAWIKKFKIASYVVAIAAFAVWGVTESAVVLAGFAAVIAAIVWVVVRYSPPTGGKATAPAFAGVTKHPQRGSYPAARHDIWTLCIGAFGVIAALPVFTAIAIILWRNTDHKEFWNFIKLFKI